MSIDHRSRGHDRPAGRDGHVSSSAIGKQTLVPQEEEEPVAAPVQRKELAGAGALPANSAGIAAAGVKASGGALPHVDRIQALFGRHDVRSISAHVSGPAKPAAEHLGASAYATGNQVAFADSPDLHTAAHEAAHVVQQRRGVTPNGNPGGEAYERHADAVADRVVAGESAEELLDGGPAGGAGEGLQRRELPDGAPLRGPGDWHAGDRARLGGTFESANLANLAANDHAQYTRIEERRDFYRWYYNYTSSRKSMTRWALAASLVANGANQVAHMNPTIEGAAQLAGTINDELQGMMRIGNQVIFDNVFPKLNRLLQQTTNTPLKYDEALLADMQILADEQSLIQPLYASVSPATIAALNNIARQKGFAGIGAWVTNGAHVAAGPYNKGGEMPKFGDGAAGASITKVGDRWNYGMEVANKFAPEPTGFVPGTPMSAVSGGYTDGSELRAVDQRHNLHMLEACIDSPSAPDPARILMLLRKLTPKEQAELNADRTADGTQFSTQIAACSFHLVPLTSVIVERTVMTTEIPAIVAAFAGGAGTSIFLPRYLAEVMRWRGVSDMTGSVPAVFPH